MTGRRLVDLDPRQVNLYIGVCFVAAIASGLATWSLGDRWGGWTLLAHRLAGLSLLVLAPAKIRSVISSESSHGRLSRSVSAVFSVLTIVTVLLGFLHASGIWHRVGEWSPLWTHQLLAFVLIPMFVWHVLTRRVRPRATDFDRRAVLRGAGIAGVAAALYGTQELAARVAGRPDRRFSGSYEVASYDPAEMPSITWIDDHTPDDTQAGTWPLRIAGSPVTIESLRERSRPIVAKLDCTGGWYSEQSWDAVPLAELVADPGGRSIRVKSRTGYDRLFAHRELDGIYLAVGYNGEPLRPRHGAPVRLIVPGRRGPWWIKWVVSIESDDRPSWLQFPLPLA